MSNRERNAERSTDSTFRTAYSHAVQYGFQALGDQVSRVIINYIQRKYNLRVDETFSRPELLCEAMERTLGSGALLIEKRMIKYLWTELHLPFAESAIQIRNSQDFASWIRDMPKGLDTTG